MSSRSGWFKGQKHSIWSHKSCFMPHHADGGARICHKSGSCQVSTALLSGCGATMWIFLLFTDYLIEVNNAVTEVYLQELGLFQWFFSWWEGTVGRMERPPKSCGKCVMAWISVWWIYNSNDPGCSAHLWPQAVLKIIFHQRPSSGRTLTWVQ